MKSILILLISLFFVLNINAQQMIMTSPDVTTTSSGVINGAMRSATGIVEGGRDITATGTLKIPIVFVKFADDNATTTHWPNANTLPSWAVNFVDSEIPSNNIYQNNNLSKFYDLSSGGNGNGTLGEFQVIGVVYFIELNKNRSDFLSDGDVSEEIIDTLDDPTGVFNVDFTEYDNWEFKVGGVPYTHDNNPDGILDFMLIYWKDKSISQPSYVGGVAGLGFSGTITKDGIDIRSSNGVLGFKSQNFGNEHTIWISAHEIGHHQFGMTGGNTGSHFNGRADRYGNIQRFGLMTRSEGHQFSAYERYRLGWLDPIIVTTTTSQTVTLNETHKSNSDNAIIIPVGYTSSGDLEEYFLLENYHSTIAYSGANPFLTKSLFNHTISKGIIVYHVSKEDFDWPTLSQVDIESAEGLFDWDVVQGASTPSDRLDDLIAASVPNAASGFDERDTITATAGSTTYRDYYPLTPNSTNDTDEKKQRRYNSNDWLGDQEDLFDMNYNNVFSNWSNPSSRKDSDTLNYSNVGFEIVSYNSSTHAYTIKVAKNFNEVKNLPPSKPQYLRVSNFRGSPLLSWTANGEPDISSYSVYRKENSSNWQFIATTTIPSYHDTEVNSNAPYDTYSYRVRAKDTQNKFSVYSNEVSILGLMPKSTEEVLIDKTPVNYYVKQNYPNPFNPTTVISYSLPKTGYVSLKVYNSLGQEVQELVNGIKREGIYNVTFNASNLPSGVYYYTLRAGSFTQTKKMLLMK